MTKLRRFKPGERIEIRELLHGRVWTLRPVTVVEDGTEHVLTWLAPGTVTNYRCNRVHSSEPTHAALLTELFGPTGVGLPFRMSSPAAE